MAAEEFFDRYSHDGARSVTWEMDTAPAGAVDEGVLRRLLAPNAEVPRKRVAIFYRPHTAADAVKIVDSDFKDALAAEQSGKGLTSAAATIKVESTARAREEQARGHGLVRFGLLVTVTEPFDGDLPARRGDHAGTWRCSRGCGSAAATAIRPRRSRRPSGSG